MSCILCKLCRVLGPDGWKWFACGCLSAARGPWVGGAGEQTATCRDELLPWLGRLRCCYPCCVFVTLTKKALRLIVSRGGPKLSVCTAFPVPLTDPPSLSALGPSSQLDRSFLFNCSTSKRCCGAPPPPPSPLGSLSTGVLASWSWEGG